MNFNPWLPSAQQQMCCRVSQYLLDRQAIEWVDHWCVLCSLVCSCETASKPVWFLLTKTKTVKNKKITDLLTKTINEKVTITKTKLMLKIAEKLKLTNKSKRKSDCSKRPLVTILYCINSVLYCRWIIHRMCWHLMAYAQRSWNHVIEL